MIAYHNRPDLKTAILAIAAEHEAADCTLSGTNIDFESAGRAPAANIQPDLG